MEQQITAMWAQVAATAGVGLLQCGLIAWGLRQMGRASDERNRQLDIMEANQRDQGQALRQVGQALDRQGQALQQVGQALERQGQALERQGQALDRHGQALDRQSQALDRQSQALAELLRRRS